MEKSGEIYEVTVVFTGHFTIRANSKREAAILATCLPPIKAGFPKGYITVNWGDDNTIEYNLEDLIRGIKQ